MTGTGSVVFDWHGAWCKPKKSPGRAVVSIRIATGTLNQTVQKHIPYEVLV